MKKNWLLTIILMLGCGLADNGRAQNANAAYQGADKWLVPSKGWPCGMPDGIPVPEHGAPVFVATMKLESYDLGMTPYGLRKVHVLQEGTVTGDKVSGVVMPGGLDFELGFSNGTMEIEQVMVLKTGDGKYIYLRNAGTAADASDVRLTLDFEAPDASGYNWLDSGRYAGRRVVDLAAKTMKLSVFDVSGLPVSDLPATANSVSVVKPAGLRDQPWDYRKKAAGEQRGDPLITESVTLGPSETVGPTKGGWRNVIPITGGTLSGKITGKILAGGADYQKLANPATLDARYLWQTEEGDVIIVRNAGPVASLVPTFEVRLDSKYAFLNQVTYLSSGPMMGAGGVKLNFYESKP
jgi:hypothetical protein